MPRKSQANLAIVGSIVSDVEIVRRLRAPDELSREQRIEFERVINSMPADWFNPGNMADLVQLCRHVIMARKIDEMIEIAMSEGQPIMEIERLIKLQVTESKVINLLLTALRMTPHSVAPSAVSKNQLRQTSSPWRGRQEKADEEIGGKVEAD